MSEIGLDPTVAADAALRAAVSDADIAALFDPVTAAGAAKARAGEILARIRPQAAALAAARPWRDALNEEP